MKKGFIVLLFVAIAATFTANAQPQSIGGRIGYGIGLSYIHGLGDNTVNLDVNFPAFYGIEAVATHDWMFPINSWQEAGKWTWFAGAGLGAGVYFSGIGFVGVAGRVGVKYEFEPVPLELGFDYRPVIGPVFGSGGAAFGAGGLYGFGFSARYVL